VTSVRDDDRPGLPGPPRGDGRAVRVAAYVLLCVLGALQALIGTFQFSRGPSWSLVAVCFALAILATCVLGAWGMHSAAGGVLPAAGWFLISVLLGTSSAGGSVLVTNTPQGKWFLFGGAVCAAGGAIISFAKWTRPRAARRSGS
jgi:hypothetical protein